MGNSLVFSGPKRAKRKGKEKLEAGVAKPDWGVEAKDRRYQSVSVSNEASSGHA